MTTDKAKSDATFDRLATEVTSTEGKMVASFMKILFPAFNQVVQEHAPLHHDTYLPTLAACLSCFVGSDLADYDDDEAMRVASSLAEHFRTQTLAARQSIRDRRQLIARSN